MSGRTALTLTTMALCLAVALPADISMPAPGNQAPAPSPGTPLKGWIKLTHNAGTPKKPVNQPVYINVAQICMVSDSKSEAPRRYSTYILLANGSDYVLESVAEVINSINSSN
jgi:hypothetical protein